MISSYVLIVIVGLFALIKRIGADVELVAAAVPPSEIKAIIEIL
jgi:hypothetical protein